MYAEYGLVNFGLAFVIGWFFVTIVNVLRKQDINLFDFAPVAWGLGFMVLNWIATL